MSRCETCQRTSCATLRGLTSKKILKGCRKAGRRLLREVAKRDRKMRESADLAFVEWLHVEFPQLRDKP